jgi:DUF1365 family protein
VSASALYEGWVRHRRHAPVQHEFRYRLYMAYLDLAELPDVLDRVPLWSARRPAPAQFRRSDYLEVDHDGPVRLLTNVRSFGHLFNPVSLYYCFDHDGDSIERVLAEVTNTPWGERHAYVLDAREGMRGELNKSMHVSPFMGMDQRYQWWTTSPGDRLGIGFRNIEDGEPAFEASLALQRRELSRPLMTRLLRTYPPMTIATLARIYLQALRLRALGAPWFAHPATT